jgi:predicted house-cleaning noncanonical NTP pyrophosphatase (MazG superfamily)
MGINCPMVPQDVNFICNSNNDFCPNQGFNAGWNKPNFLFSNCQQGGMGQNFNRSEPSLKDIVRDHLRINLEVGRKLLATDKIMESIDNKMKNFTVAVQNQLNFNKVLEMRIAQLAVALSHPNGGDFPSQPSVPIKENVKAVITQSGKTMAEHKAKSKKMGPTDPVVEEEKAEAEVEGELRPEKEEENLGKASPKDISDTHLLPFPRQAKKSVEDECHTPVLRNETEASVRVPRMFKSHVQ